MFVAKQHALGTPESHLWLFKGFVRLLQPEFVQLVEAGTVPQAHSISRMVLYMRQDAAIGACGGSLSGLTDE